MRDNKKALLTISGTTSSFNIIHAANGPDAIDISSMYKESNILTYDPGFASTASCKSSITFIDGERGILRYRGYDIAELASHKEFIEVVYLLINNNLYNKDGMSKFVECLKKFSEIPSSVISVIKSFDHSAHPMTMLSGAFSALASVYQSNASEIYIEVAVASMPGIIANIYKHAIGDETISHEYKESKSYSENFLSMMFDQCSVENAEILEKILILHADHEQNASTSAVRLVSSTEANPILALVSGCISLSGQLHGGANEKVINMLEEILKNGGDVEEYIQKARNKNDPFKLFGFGHRVYKNYDPRAKILAGLANKIITKKCNQNTELFDIANKLEKAALSDQYFIDRKLYPNVDFYSGILLKHIGIPSNMFTMIFALARVSGWVAQIKEMKSDKEKKISRPMQVYIGESLRGLDG